MNIFQLKLVPRLILASLPNFAAPWFDDLLYRLTGSSPLFFSETYGPLFALLVLAPFITATSARAIRALAMCIVTYGVYYAATWCVVNTPSPLERWVEADFLQFVNVIPIALAATWMLAAAVAWIAPLRSSRRYWIYTGLAGFATGLEFLLIDYINPSGWYVDWLFIVQPFWIWPVTTCVAIYCGREK